MARTDSLDRCAICGWRLADEEDHRRSADPRGEIERDICEHCAACRSMGLVAPVWPPESAHPVTVET